MKILYIITGLGLGGAETITVNLAERIHALGHSVGIISLTGEWEIPVGENIPVWTLHMKKNLKGLFIALWKAKKIIDDFKPDVIHAHMFHAVIFARLLKVISTEHNKVISTEHNKVISTEHNKVISTEHTNSLEKRFRMLVYRYTDFLSDKNTNVSQEATDYFIHEKAFSKRKSLPVYNGIDTNRFKQNGNGWKVRKQYGIDSKCFVFINVARLVPAKDQANLLRAFSLLDGFNVKLMIVGKGELEETLRELVMGLGLEERVLFCGTHPNIEDFYNAADCFVLSSAWEGFGLVLAEAMACGLPVVSTDCGGTAEVVQDRQYLVPPRNPQLLAEKMKEIANSSQEQRLLIGGRNRNKVQKFDLGHIAANWIQIYREV